MSTADLPQVPADLAWPIVLGIDPEARGDVAGRAPAVVVVEHAYTAVNMQSALRVGEGRGVALSAAAVHGAEVVQYQASEAKKSIVGDGLAKKERVAAMVAKELGLDAAPEPLDATDALALALTYVHRQRFADRLA